MSDLPKGWAETLLSDISSLKNGYAFKSKEYTESGLPILRMGNITKEFRVTWKKKKQPYIAASRKKEFESFLLRQGDLVMCLTDLSNTGQYLGTVGLIDTDTIALLNQRVAKVEESSHGPSTKFLYYRLRNHDFRSFITLDDSGSLQKNTSISYAANFKLALPPAAEQERIVKKLDTIFEQLNETKARLNRVPDLLKQFRQSYLERVFSGALSSKSNESITSELTKARLAKTKLIEAKELRKEKELEPLPPANQLEALPSGWQWIQLGDTFIVYVGSTPSRSNSAYWNGAINWVSSGEVAFSDITKSEEKITQSGLDNSSCKVHPPGTVMLGMIGEGKTRGQTAVLRIDASHNQNTAAIRLDHTSCLPEYIYWYLFYKYEETRRIGSGNNQQALNKERVRNLLIPLPPIDIQSDLVRKIKLKMELLAILEQTIRKQLRNLEKVEASVLKQAFDGHLVDQSPSDEPASVLLEKIQAEREAAKPKKKATKKKVTRKKSTTSITSSSSKSAIAAKKA